MGTFWHLFSGNKRMQINICLFSNFLSLYFSFVLPYSSVLHLTESLRFLIPYWTRPGHMERYLKGFLSMLESRVRPKQLLSSFFSLGAFQYSYLPQSEKCLQGAWHPGPPQLNNLNFPQPHSYVLLFKLLQTSHWSSQSEVWWYVQVEMGVSKKKTDYSLFHGGLFPHFLFINFCH